MVLPCGPFDGKQRKRGKIIVSELREMTRSDTDRDAEWESFASRCYPDCCTDGWMVMGLARAANSNSGAATLKMKFSEHFKIFFSNFAVEAILF